MKRIVLNGFAYKQEFEGVENSISLEVAADLLENEPELFEQ